MIVVMTLEVSQFSLPFVSPPVPHWQRHGQLDVNTVNASLRRIS